MFTTPRIIAVAGSLALALAAPGAALAHGNGGSHGHHGHSGSHGQSGANHGKGHGKGKGHNHDKFTAVGTVTAVDGEGGTLTVADKGGTRALHGTSVTITVPSDARVIVDDNDATLADVVVGDHVVVKGSDANDTYTATKVVASSSTDSTDGDSGDSGDSGSTGDQGGDTTDS